MAINFMRRVLLQAAALFPSGVVFGASYREARKIHSAYLGASDKTAFVSNFTREGLERTLLLAAECSFYKRYDFDVPFDSLPLIDKRTIREAGDSMVRSKRGADYITTGGTSGRPLGFFIDKARRGTEWYWMTQGWAHIGFDFATSWRGVLRNHRLSGKDLQIDPLLREIRFDNFRLDEPYLGRITSILRKKTVPYIHAYPSAAYSLARFWSENGGRPQNVHAFLCGSENVLPEQKRLIQDQLGIRMFTWYGHSEKLILAHEGAICENYHCNPFYGYAELVDGQGLQVKEPGQLGELVGTGFINRKTPFIRYKTGDYAEFVGHTCPECGHIGLTFKNVRGRWNGDKIYRSDGTVITTTALNLHDSIYEAIDGLQYVQESVGHLEVRVIPGSSWNEKMKEALLNDLRGKAGLALYLSVHEVAELEYTSNRKYQLLIQRIQNR